MIPIRFLEHARIVAHPEVIRMGRCLDRSSEGIAPAFKCRGCRTGWAVPSAFADTDPTLNALFLGPEERVAGLVGDG
jgi:hypothetical protein